MNYLTAQHITKSYGERTLFQDLNLIINQGDKIALIARNGTGKSTFLKILAGILPSDGDAARIIYHQDIRVYFLDQQPQMPSDVMPMAYILDADNPKIRVYNEYQRAVAEQDMDAMEKLSLAMDDHKAWNVGASIEALCSRFHIDFLDTPLNRLSGGQQKRLSIVKMLAEEPDLMILDEPTNHLDIDAIEWLEEYLSKPSHTLLMVSHDRYFLECVCDNILEIEDEQLWKYPGSYSTYLEQKNAKLNNEEARQRKLKSLFSKELDWVRRSPKARTTKSKSRIQKFQELKKETQQVYQPEDVDFIIKSTRMGSKIVEIHNACIAFGSNQIIKPFSYKFKKNERLALVGPNGAGKSTFLKLITEQLPPSSGKIVVGDTITFGYYGQQGLTASPTKTILEIIRDIAEYIPLEKGAKLSAEQLLERFMFPRSQHRQQFGKLSGGEKRRLYLLTVLMSNPNFLILDEPTNDLDIHTLNALEQYLMHFQGCLLLVTHDRYMADKLVEHMFIFDGHGNIKDFNGNYTDYLTFKKQHGISSFSSDKHEKTDTHTATIETSKTDQYQLRKDIKRIENQIKKLEDNKEKIENQFLNSNLSVDDMLSLQSELKEVTEILSAKEMEWMELVEMLEK